MAAALDRPLQQPAPTVPPADDEPSGRSVTVLPDDIIVTAREEETILAALGRAGLRYRIGCRRGGCGICKLHLRLGEVRYTHRVAETVLTDDEKVDGVCLSCRAVPVTNVVIELQEGDRLRRVLQLGFASGAARDVPRSPGSTPAPPTKGRS